MSTAALSLWGTRWAPLAAAWWVPWATRWSGVAPAGGAPRRAGLCQPCLDYRAVGVIAPEPLAGVRDPAAAAGDKRDGVLICGLHDVRATVVVSVDGVAVGVHGEVGERLVDVFA